MCARVSWHSIVVASPSKVESCVFRKHVILFTNRPAHSFISITTRVPAVDLLETCAQHARQSPDATENPGPRSAPTSEPEAPLCISV